MRFIEIAPDELLRRLAKLPSDELMYWQIGWWDNIDGHEEETAALAAHGILDYDFQLHRLFRLAQVVRADIEEPCPTGKDSPVERTNRTTVVRARGLSPITAPPW